MYFINWIIKICSLSDQSKYYNDYKSKRRWVYTVLLFTWKLKEKKHCIWEDWAKSYKFLYLSSLQCQCQYDQISHQKWRFSLQNHESSQEWILHVYKNVLKAEISLNFTSIWWNLTSTNFTLIWSTRIWLQDDYSTNEFMSYSLFDKL